MFILLARDKHAPALVWLWATLRELASEKTEVTAEARECAVAMIEWAANNGRRSSGLGEALMAAALELIRVANAAVKSPPNAETSIDVVRRFLCETDFGPVPAVESTTVHDDAPRVITAEQRAHLTDAQIIAIRDEYLPAQGDAFDSIAFARAIAAAVLP